MEKNKTKRENNFDGDRAIMIIENAQYIKSCITHSQRTCMPLSAEIVDHLKSF